MARAFRLPRPLLPVLTCFVCLSLCCAIAHAQDLHHGISRSSSGSPHGLAYQPPTVLSPAAVEFFHPALPPRANDIGASSGGAGAPAGGTVLPPAVPVLASPVHEKVLPIEEVGGSGATAGTRVVGIALGAVFAVLLASGAYCILRKWGARAEKAGGARCLLIA